ncbi:hypothetical protein HK102_011265, partial [Quaeritorhiza haematococci]
PHLKTLYQELLKRMDDAQDELRILAASTISKLVYAVDRWTTYFASASASASETGPAGNGHPSSSLAGGVSVNEGKLEEMSIDDNNGGDGGDGEDVVGSVEGKKGDVKVKVTTPSVVDLGGGRFVETRFDEVHWQSIVKTMSIHMDDANRSVQ